MPSFAIALLCFAGSAAFAQTFEVASIKSTAPQEVGRMMVRMGGDPGRLDYVNVSLRDMIRSAYDVKDYQVVGPDWLNTIRFDLQAKYPPDTPREVRNVMMQNLLAERFGVKIHKESKEVSVYNLVAAKGGPKLKKAEEGPSTFEVPAGPGGPGGNTERRLDGPGGPAAGGSAGGVRVGGGPGGPGGPGGGRGPGGPGMIMMRMGGPGSMKMTAKAMTMGSLADMLARQIGKPVIDQTGIAGNYDIDLEFKPEEGMGMMRGMPMPMPGAGGGAPAGHEANAETGASIFTAIQDQLGLKLDAKKGPVETIVVDQANKTPTEN
jgi:uncharacterized protein (TIGR03435 family)